MNGISKQARKHAIGLAGEFLVAGELLRRGVTAAVTYGNAKKADVVAVKENRAISLEVKTTSEPKWIIGNRVPESSDDIWVLVFLDKNERVPPRYFILTANELHDLLQPEHLAYTIKYRAKHGKEFGGNGVVSLRRNLVAQQEYEGAWHKITQMLLTS